MTTPRQLLILDLDETLIHAAEQPLDRAPDFQLGQYFVYKRPHVGAFLSRMAERFDLAVWTSATRDYAAEAVAKLFPVGVQPIFVWARDRCVQRRTADGTCRVVYIKDLKKVCRRWDYPLSRVLVVDDEPAKLQRQYGNLVPIPPFYGEPGDETLRYLAAWLTRLGGVEDVRRIEKRYWGAGAEVPGLSPHALPTG